MKKLFSLSSDDLIKFAISFKIINCPPAPYLRTSPYVRMILLLKIEQFYGDKPRQFFEDVGRFQNLKLFI